MQDLSKLESGGASTQVDPESPLMRAWEAFKKSEAYANSLKWAAYEEHREGSLWAMFSTGFLAGTALERERTDEILARLKARIESP